MFRTFDIRILMKYKILLLWIIPILLLAFIGFMNIAMETGSATAAAAPTTIQETVPPPGYITTGDDGGAMTGDVSLGEPWTEDTWNFLKMLFFTPILLVTLLWIVSNKKIYLREPLVVA
jgi:hypothetical protein